MLLQKIIQFIISKAKKSRVIQSIFEKPIDVRTLPQKGIFTDSKGNTFLLYDQLRSKIKPGWETYFQSTIAPNAVSPKFASDIAQDGRLSVMRIEALLNTFCGGIADKHILEIGCHAGGVTNTFAEKNAKSVTGTDFVEYKVSSMTSESERDTAPTKVNNHLKDLRLAVAKHFHHNTTTTYCNDDICNSALPDNSYDIVCSWDVFEHLHDSKNALKSIYRILKKDGISIHQYNPFFALNGGHSPCTIDFLWGHVLLSAKDYEKYNDTIQPEKKEKAMAFYESGLNRMTIFDLKQYIKESGFELLAFIPYIKEQHVRILDEKIIKIAKINYPTSTVEDLISSRIVFVVKKI